MDVLLGLSTIAICLLGFLFWLACGEEFRGRMPLPDYPEIKLKGTTKNTLR